ncbi:MAG: hypothetical protein ACN6PD_01225 [Sphingobacterium sp.]
MYYQISRWDLVRRSIIKGMMLMPKKNFKLELSYPIEQQLVITKDKIDEFKRWLLESD